MTATISDPRAWRANTIDRPESWYYPLSEATLAALDRDIRGWKRDLQSVTDLTASDWLRKAGATDRDRVLTALEKGRGFVVVTAGAPGRYSPAELTAVYWLVGQLLGRPF